jgi:RNA polymerase sigma-70 factor (ECF subfamily)
MENINTIYCPVMWETREAEMPLQDFENNVIDSVLNGNVDDFLVLVNKYQSRVYSLVAKRVPSNDIDDVAQEAFFRAFKNLKTFSRQKPFENWLSIITLRSCCDYWRKNSRQKEFTAPASETEQIKWLEFVATEATTAEYEQKSLNKDIRELLKWTLSKLSAEDRALIEIIYFEGYSIKEAAEVMKWGSSKTKVRAMRARTKMRKIISKLFEAYN